MNWRRWWRRRQVSHKKHPVAFSPKQISQAFLYFGFHDGKRSRDEHNGDVGDDEL